MSHDDDTPTDRDRSYAQERTRTFPLGHCVNCGEPLTWVPCTNCDHPNPDAESEDE